ncbi:hypothetical protein [Nocardia brevicatena]|uniref:hypothetical protein n=1 Tax=Nocardia brevicatena TaxID=37327 RepID=UPI0003074E13|nr:hypothetical protein [Nocardia brevicatena]
MSNVRTVVEEFFRRARTGEFARIGEIFTDEGDRYIYGADAVPWTGRRVGVQEHSREKSR